MLPYSRIAILFAVPQEMAPFAAGIQQKTKAPELGGLPHHLGTIGSRAVLCAVGGVGVRNARRSAEAILADWKPDLIVMAGVAGALSPDLRIGEVIAAEWVDSGGARATPAITPTSSSAGTVPHQRAGFLSVDRVLATAAEKRKTWGSANGESPVAVEMETAGVIAAATEAAVPWAAVRAVSDTANESLPLDFNQYRDASGGLPVSRIALAAITHPTAIPGLMRLGRNTSIAATALARFLHAWLA